MDDLVLDADWREREDVAWRVLRRARATGDEADRLIDTPTRFVDTDGTVLGAYLPCPPDATALVEGLRSRLANLPLVVQGGYRTDGMQTRASMFGYRPRLTLQGLDFCAPCAFNRDEPLAVDLFARTAEALLPTYEALNPDVYAAHTAAAGEIGDAWHYAGPYTAGIFNRDNPLAFHRDTGNIKGSWNIQVTWRTPESEGGTLVIPGWNVALACSDATVCLFDAGATTHGVAPIVKRRRDAWRCSVVYYSVSAMRRCLPREEEKVQARRRRTEREDRRAAGLMPHEKMP